MSIIRGWCHVCNNHVSGVRNEDDEIVCDLCNEIGFMELIDRPRVGCNIYEIVDGLNIRLVQQRTVAVTRTARIYPLAEVERGGENTGDFLRRFVDQFNNLTSDDHFNQILQYLTENDNNIYGTPPTSQNILNNIKKSLATADMINYECSVCQECFHTESEVVYFSSLDFNCTCTHIFHYDCILKWLRIHNSCPICRYELPTDDPEYEQRKNLRIQQALNAVRQNEI